MLIDNARRVIEQLGKGLVDLDRQVVLVPRPVLDEYEKRLKPYQAFCMLGAVEENRACEGIAIMAESTSHAWMQFAGMFGDDPLFDDWQASISERRQECEEDPTIP